MKLEELSLNVQKGKAKIVEQLVAELLDEGVVAQNILDNGLLAAMDIIGPKFKNNELFVPEVLIAARALNAGLAVLKPYLIADGEKDNGTIILGTVKGDLHDIGKNLVKIMMEGKGIKVVDIGVDVPAEKFIEAAAEHNANLICCSALLTTTMPQFIEIVKERQASDLPEKVKVMIGGAPVTQEYCDKISADFYTPDAASAATVAFEYLESVN